MYAQFKLCALALGSLHLHHSSVIGTADDTATRHNAKGLAWLLCFQVNMVVSVVGAMSTPYVCVQIGLYSISFGFAWGPIGWLVPSEIHDLNTRSAGQSITVFTQLVSGAIVTQSMFPNIFSFGHVSHMLFQMLMSQHFKNACNLTPVLRLSVC